jgi:hypothetical protein
MRMRSMSGYLLAREVSIHNCHHSWRKHLVLQPTVFVTRENMHVTGRMCLSSTIYDVAMIVGSKLTSVAALICCSFLGQKTYFEMTLRFSLKRLLWSTMLYHWNVLNFEMV